MKQELKIKTVKIEELNNANKSLNSALKDIETVTEFINNDCVLIKSIKNADGTKTELAFKLDSAKIDNMHKLHKTLKDNTVKYAFGKKIKNSATRELNNYLKNQ